MPLDGFHVPDDRYAVGFEALRDAVSSARARNLRPPPKLGLTAWAERYAVLSKETSAQTGRYRPYGYQRGIMDAITDPTITQVTVMKSARVGYTRILDNAIGYYLHQDPSPILVVQPRGEDAEDYSKTEIAPMLRDTPVLAAICPVSKAKDTAQTILQKSFLNGSSLRLVGANSPGGFRRITVRAVLLDEVDGYPVGGAGSEGDQVALAWKRAESFWNRKLVLGSTPTIKGISRIEKEIEKSDCREYHVPCPHCGHRQVLRWGGKDADFGIKWSKNEAGEGLPETTYYLCNSGNGCCIDWSDLPAMDAAGEWIATRPSKGHAGFRLWTGMSLMVNAAWPLLVAEWLKVKSDPLQRQTFVNLVLGEPYEDRGDLALSEHALAARGETWDAQVPSGVGLLTAGVDTQDGRFEIEVTGWGMNEESWSIEHDVIDGDPNDPATTAQLQAYLSRTWYRADGRPFTIMAVCIDSGGHKTQAVYDFSLKNLQKRWWAIKGESARAGERNPVWPTKRPTSRSKQSFRPIILGVNAAKDRIRANLALPPPKEIGAPMPGYCHFPAARDLNYFSQLVSESLITVSIGGKKARIWRQMPGRANEALDLRVYAYAALCGLQHFGLQLNRRVAEVSLPYVQQAASDETRPAPIAAPTPETPPHPRPQAQQASSQPAKPAPARPVLPKRDFSKLIRRLA